MGPTPEGQITPHACSREEIGCLAFCQPFGVAGTVACGEHETLRGGGLIPVAQLG